jgi:putative transposase
MARVLKVCFAYHQRWRTHPSLGMDCPETRLAQEPWMGKVIPLPEVGGLHPHYERRAVWGQAGEPDPDRPGCCQHVRLAE